MICFEVKNKYTGIKYTVYGVRYENKNTRFLIYDWDLLEWKWVYVDDYRPV